MLMAQCRFCNRNNQVSKLEDDTRKMEEQLEQIRKFKEMEMQKRTEQMNSSQQNTEGTKWRSATQN